MQAYAGVEKHVAELERMQRHIAPHQIEIDRMNAFAGQTKYLRANGMPCAIPACTMLVLTAWPSIELWNRRIMRQRK